MVYIYLLDKSQQGIFVVIPIFLQFPGIRELTTAQFKGNFKTVTVKVIVVLHSSLHAVPVSAICDSWENRAE
jgi:hypothetical protein